MIPRPIVGLKFSTLATQACGINSLESIPGLHRSLKIPSLAAARDRRRKGWGRSGERGGGRRLIENLKGAHFSYV